MVLVIGILGHQRDFFLVPVPCACASGEADNPGNARGVSTVLLWVISTTSENRNKKTMGDHVPLKSESIQLADFRMHYMIGGSGPAVVLVHGAWDSWWAWRTIATELVKTHTVIIPAMRGLALSGKPLAGYDGDTLGRDIHDVLEALGIDRVSVVGHDWGGQGAYTLAAQFPETVERLAIFEWALPGTGFIEAAWTPQPEGNYLWHMGLQSVPDIAEVLIRNSLRPFMDFFFNNYAAVRGAISAESLDHYVGLYEQPGALRALMAIYHELWVDADQTAVHLQKPLKMPILAYGGDACWGSATFESVKLAGSDVTGGVIPMCGHWVAEEQPEFVLTELKAFLAR
jgi:pimeloyl-ACP methyl ester carboxylesterase